MNGKWIAGAALVGLAVGCIAILVFVALPTRKHSDSVERELAKYREQSVRLAEELRNAQRAVDETASRLADLSKALVNATGSVSRLSETNKRLAGTVDQLAGIGVGLAEGVDEADRIADTIRDLAGKSLDTVRGLQGSGGKTSP